MKKISLSICKIQYFIFADPVNYSINVAKSVETRALVLKKRVDGSVVFVVEPPKIQYKNNIV